MIKSINIADSKLIPGLFKERADINREYLMELKKEDLLQNFYLEAGIRTDRKSYCTGGQNLGEFWVAPHKLGAFMGERTQEFCTVYNMVKLSDYLFRFTGDVQYLDYIEKNGSEK